MTKHIDYELENERRVWYFNKTGGDAASNLTVRDYFAAKAMQALLTKQDPKVVDITEEAYDWADMMIEERNK